MKIKNSKGQLSTLDLVASMLLFMVVVSMSLWAQGETNNTLWNYEDLQAYRDKALDITDILLKTGGTPSDWESLLNLTENVTALGLVSEPSVLDTQKLARFSDIPYAVSKRLLGLAKEGYYIEITDIADEPIYSFGVDRTAFSAAERPALLGNEIVKFKIRLFKE